MSEGPQGIPGEQGPQGVRGTQGRRGIRGVPGTQGRGGQSGMTTGAAHAFIYLTVLMLALSVLNFLYTTRIDHQSRARDQQVNRNSVAILRHEHHDDELRAALCAALPALEQHVIPAARPDFTQLDKALACAR